MRSVSRLVPAWVALCATACAASRPPERVTLRFVNDGPEAICAIHLRRSEHFAAGWGTDWLDRGERVAPGAERSFKVPPGGRWDLQISACRVEALVLGQLQRHPITADTSLRASELE